MKKQCSSPFIKEHISSSRIDPILERPRHLRKQTRNNKEMFLFLKRVAKHGQVPIMTFTIKDLLLNIEHTQRKSRLGKG